MKKNKRDIKVRMGGIIRILTPVDFDKLRDQAPTSTEKFLLDMMLNTGMRYVELQRYIKSIENEKWFDKKRNKIVLPSNATKTFVSRNVLLTPEFTNILSRELERDNPEIPLVTYQTLDNRLKRWAINADIETPNILAVKTFRKTWESWLVSANRNVLKILSSQGHSSTTALNFYLTCGFTKEEIDEMIERTRGWGELVEKSPIISPLFLLGIGGEKEE